MSDVNHYHEYAIEIPVKAMKGLCFSASKSEGPIEVDWIRIWGVCEPALKPQFVQEGLYPDRPRSEPDLGSPTVRDRREAYGNASSGQG
jgi:hypothetical protein